jgi:hypothetical protein
MPLPAIEEFAKAHDLIVIGPTQSTIVISPGTKGSITADVGPWADMATSTALSINSTESAK